MTTDEMQGNRANSALMNWHLMARAEKTTISKLVSGLHWNLQYFSYKKKIWMGTVLMLPGLKTNFSTAENSLQYLGNTLFVIQSENKHTVENELCFLFPSKM